MPPERSMLHRNTKRRGGKAMGTLRETMNSEPPRPGRTLALASMLNAAGGGLGWSLFPALLPEIAPQLGLTHRTAGLAWGAAALGIALASPLGGALADRKGPRRVAGVAMLVGAVACAARALAVGPWSLALVMLLFGAHIGFVAPSIPKALAAEIPPAGLGRANGTALLAYTLTTALVMLIGRALIAPAFGGWRGASLFAAAAMAIAGAIWLALARGRSPAPSPSSAAASQHAGPALLRSPGLLSVGAMQFLLFGGYLTLLGLLPRALAENGVAPTRVGAVVASWLVAAAAANIGGPLLSDRLARRKPLLVGGALVAGAGLLAFALLGDRFAIGALVIAALGGGSIAPLLLTLPFELEEVGPARAGAAVGLVLLLGQAGGFLLPIATGAVADAHGLGGAMLLLALLHLAIGAAALPLHERGRAPAKRVRAAIEATPRSEPSGL
jgi:cyanate permease